VVDHEEFAARLRGIEFQSEFLDRGLYGDERSLGVRMARRTRRAGPSWIVRGARFRRDVQLDVE
jgi:hypothetical protein